MVNPRLRQQIAVGWSDGSQDPSNWLLGARLWLMIPVSYLSSTLVAAAGWENDVPSQEIADLQDAIAELQVGLRSVVDAAHSTIHLLAYLFATRCLAAPDPRKAYKDIAGELLASIGGTDGVRSSTGDELYDAAVRGVRHHVGQFLLTLQAYVEASLKQVA